MLTREMKSKKIQRVTTAVLWVLAVATAVSSARYLFFSAATLVNINIEDAAARMTARWTGTAPTPALHPFSHQPLLLLLHVGGGIVALLCGLFQFLPRLRQTRPKVHRAIGTIYAAATVVAGASGFPLSFLFYTATDESLRGRLGPAAAGFAALSVVWPILTILAFVRARQRRFTEHRLWMIRSYSLTAVAITTRVFAFPLLVITRDPILTINLVVLSWPLNLLFAEMVVRRRAPYATVKPLATAHTAKS
jgi:uncharacterized membrane protein